MENIISLENKIISSHIKQSSIKHFNIEINNINIHYITCKHSEIKTKNEKQNVLMIHGLGGSSLSFVNIIDYLTPFYNLFIIDLPGFGRSGTHDSLCNKDISMHNVIQFYTDIIKQFVDKINIKEFVLLGHSLGGLFSLAFLLNSNDVQKIKKLILLNPVGIFPFTNSYGFFVALFAKYDLNLVSFNTYSKLFGNKRMKLTKLYKVLLFNSPTFSKGLIQNFFKINKTAKLNFEIETKSYIKDIPKLNIPIGFIYGGKDKIIPFYHGLYLRKHYDVSLHIVKHLGHCCSHKNPVVLEELAYAIHTMILKSKTFIKTDIDKEYQYLIENIKNNSNIFKTFKKIQKHIIHTCSDIDNI